MIEYIITLAQVIGLMVLAWVAVVIFCLMVLTVLFAWSFWVDHKKARTGRHHTAGKLLSVPDEAIVNGFFEMSDEDKSEERIQQEDLDALRKQLTDPNYYARPEPAEYNPSEEDLEALRKKLNSPTDETAVFEPFDPIPYHERQSS